MTKFIVGCAVLVGFLLMLCGACTEAVWDNTAGYIVVFRGQCFHAKSISRLESGEYTVELRDKTVWHTFDISYVSIEPDFPAEDAAEFLGFSYAECRQTRNPVKREEYNGQ